MVWNNFLYKCLREQIADTSMSGESYIDNIEAASVSHIKIIRPWTIG